MYISKKKQAIIDAFKTQKEKDDYIDILKMEYLERVRQRSEKYYKENPEKLKEHNIKYYKANHEKAKEQQAKYRKKNAEKLRNKRVIYLAKKKAEKQLIENV